MWNLDDLYKDFDDSYLKDFAKLENFVKEFKKLVSEMFNLSDIDLLEKYVFISEKIERITNNLYSYANLRFCTNVNDKTPMTFNLKVEELLISLTKDYVKFKRHISDIDLDKLKHKSKVIFENLYHLNKVQLESKFLLSEDLEELLEKMTLLASDSWEQLQEIVTSNIEIDFQNKKLTLSEIRNLAYNKDQKIRKDAFEAEIKALKSVEEYVALALTNIKRQVNMVNSLRGYETIFEPTLINNRMSSKTLELLINSIENHRNYFSLYLKKKSNYLGHSNGLPFYDLFAPIGEVTKKYSFEEAKKIILGAFYNFSNNLGDFAKKAFENNWIDISPRKGKVGGAFCDNLPQINQSRILVNFTGTLSDVLTLAHELGHGFHGEMISRNTPLNWDYPMPLAETASIFCESIVNEFLINNVKNDNELLNILENELQDNTQVIIDILSRYYFESKLFDEANKPLNVEDIKLWMKESQKKAYLDGLDKDVLHPYMWLIKSHYYDAEYNFYNFPYAFGLLFGKALFTKYKENPNQFTSDYEIFLQFTTKDSIEEVSKKIGIDLNSETFWNNSFRIIKQNITRVINLIDKIKDAY
jgi:pepF/M3 family oligoendopeptidase